MKENTPLLELRGISKRFPGVQALKDVQLDLYAGEVLALIGENGAGKSTLMKILLGSYQQDEGEMFFNGKAFKPNSPADALHRGISMIHQEISLIPSMTVAENIFLGREADFSSFGVLSVRKRLDAAKALLHKLGLDINPNAEVSRLSVANMQLVEIVRAVSYNPKVIIMDEPTSALTLTEVDKLYKIIENLAKKGTGIIFISHKLEELYKVCNRITILRDGQYVDSKPIQEITQNELITKMVGREISNKFPKQNISIGETVLEAKNLTHKGYFKDISFELHKGEILGFCGLMGAGRTEIMNAVFGIDKKSSGMLLMHGKQIHNHSISQAIQNKIAMVTEDRLRFGVIHMLSVKINITIAYLKKICKFDFINFKAEQHDCDDMIDTLQIKVATDDQEIGLLSGGNQQKAILAKWLLTEPEVLILDEPTRGIDVGSKSEIYRLIGDFASKGKAVLLVSSELPELLGICDRIIVIREGQNVSEFSRKEFDQEKLMSHAFGVLAN